MLRDPLEGRAEAPLPHLQQVLDDRGKRRRQLVVHAARLELVGHLVLADEEVVLAARPLQ